MNRIVLIGNGFDLAHKLPTKYEDFINWYWSKRIDEMLCANKIIVDDGLCSLKIKDKDKTWTNFFYYIHIPEHTRSEIRRRSQRLREA